MMRIGIMQPYFFPYIGYWQLISAVDKYVVFDDVNFINRGWINRNRILINNSEAYFNVPIIGASQNKLIMDINVRNDDKEINTNLKRISMSYKKTPYFEETYPLIEEILTSKIPTLGNYNYYLIQKVCNHLDINTNIVLSSEINKNNDLKGEEKIINICKIMGADIYINAVGGRELYHKDRFDKEGITLYFLKTDDIEYVQFGTDFTPRLSIIDVLMFNGREVTKSFLKRYTLIGD